MSWKYLLSPPEMSSVERELLLDAFDSGWIAPAGPDLDAFEQELCALTGAAAAAGLSSGTAGLHLALLALGVGQGDEVLLSDLTFGASAFAVTYVGATPVFVDSEPGSWQLDAALLERELARRAATGTLPAAVVAVHLYGSVCDGTRIAAACAAHGVPLVEDAAEAVGASRDGVMAGCFGTVSVLSFNGNKIVTTGGGGALLSNDLALVARARHLATQARRAVPWYEHDEIGFNYRLGNLNAAVGRGQLRTLPQRIANRSAVRGAYEHELGSAPGMAFQEVPMGCVPNHWLTTIQLQPAEFGATAEQVLAHVRDHGIEARHGFKPMHQQPVFAGATLVTASGASGGSATSVSARHFECSISLPSSSFLTVEDVQFIARTVLAARR